MMNMKSLLVGYFLLKKIICTVSHKENIIKEKLPNQSILYQQQYNNFNPLNLQTKFYKNLIQNIIQDRDIKKKLLNHFKTSFQDHKLKKSLPKILINHQKNYEVILENINFQAIDLKLFYNRTKIHKKYKKINFNILDDILIENKQSYINFYIITLLDRCIQNYILTYKKKKFLIKK